MRLHSKNFVICSLTLTLTISNLFFVRQFQQQDQQMIKLRRTQVEEGKRKQMKALHDIEGCKNANQELAETENASQNQTDVSHRTELKPREEGKYASVNHTDHFSSNHFHQLKDIHVTMQPQFVDDNATVSIFYRSPPHTLLNGVTVAFSFSTELDLLHVKLDLLYDFVDIFIVCECAFSMKGYRKSLIFNLHKHESRFSKYRSKIVHLIDYKNPGMTGKKLGWAQEARPKAVIGEYLMHNASHANPDSIIFMSDMDEFPSLDSLQWTKRNLRPGHTFVYKTFYYLYGFQWLVSSSSMSTMTARLLQDETRFWQSRMTGEQSKFKQKLQQMPDHVHPGYHCGYCQSPHFNVLKLRHANVIDGPPFLTEYYWDVEIFTKLRACGVSPRGKKLLRTEVQGMSFSIYPYQNANHTEKCDAISITRSDWQKLAPELQQCSYVHFNLSK
mmetsp:Transcript_65145/g.95403  ORF Transcript_65145/g.95403 Transcript_65145/m.95403 type:complete len:444 (+) Transcript_65145:437-1768(+)